MLKSDLRTILALCFVLFFILAILPLFSWAVKAIEDTRAFSQIEPCKDIIEGEGQLECIFRSIDNTVKDGNLEKAFSIFASAYKNFESFSGSGCHRHAHRVGDTVYYNYYIFGDQDLNKIKFPQETTACGYGLFHGFLEHLIQDHPDPEFAMDVCETLEANLSETMGDIRVICYHGTGHGYTLAHAETIAKSDWGDVNIFSEVPISKCNAMVRATESEKEDCRQGVFNVIADWASAEDFGFRHNVGDPFVLCKLIPEDVKYSCYYEMAQKMTGVAENDPVKLYEIVSTAKRSDLVDIVFRVSVAGVIQNTIVDGNGYENTLSRCALVPTDFFKPCIESLVWGLYEHGTPQEEYKKVLLLCEEPLVDERGEKNTCYRKMIDRLPRFYDNKRIGSICTELPEEYEQLCFDIHLEKI